MTEERTDQSTEERHESLWWLTVSPLLWAAHFLVTYGTVAIWCGKVVARNAPLGLARWLVLAYTLAALAGVLATAWRGYRRHEYGTAAVPHDFDTPADRHRFLGFAVLLLSGLSAVAIVYVALAAVFIGSCR